MNNDGKMMRENARFMFKAHKDKRIETMRGSVYGCLFTAAQED